MEEKQRQFEEVERELLRFEASQEASRAVLSPLRARAVAEGSSCVAEARSKLASLKQGRIALAEGIASTSRQRSALAQGERRLSNDYEQARSEVASAEAAVAKIAVTVSEDDPEIARKVAEACCGESCAIGELEKSYAKASVFNLGKRRRIREELAVAKKAFEASREAVIRAIEEELVAKERAAQEANVEKLRARERALGEQLSDVQMRLDAVGRQLTESNAKLRKVDATRNDLEAFANEVDRIVAQFEEVEYPILRKGEYFDNLKKLAPGLVAYIEACGALSLSQRRDIKEGRRGLKAREERSLRAKEEYEAEARAVFDEGDEVVLVQAERLRDELDVRAFDEVLSRMVDALAARHEAGRNLNGRYRHRLYLQAVLCLFYYGAPSVSGMCACIDEAQDLSPAEHALIRASLGIDPVVNLYGDVNQLIYPYKGLDDWARLGEDLPAARFELHENYRNTVQITDYCNTSLGMEVTAVGLQGPEVRVASMEEAVVLLLELQANFEGLRCAVVYSQKCEHALEAITFLLGEHASVGSARSGKVVVLPVGLSKGLEFDAVLVVEDEMTKNEKYVAFTRSLETLIVAGLSASLDEESEDDCSVSNNGFFDAETLLSRISAENL